MASGYLVFLSHKFPLSLRMGWWGMPDTLDMQLPISSYVGYLSVLTFLGANFVQPVPTYGLVWLRLWFISIRWLTGERDC